MKRIMAFLLCVLLLLFSFGVSAAAVTCYKADALAPMDGGEDVAAAPDGTVTVEPAKKSIVVPEIVAVVIAVIVALLVGAVLKGQMKTNVKQSAAAVYVREGSFELTEKTDKHLRTSVETRPIAQKSDQADT